MSYEFEIKVIKGDYGYNINLLAVDEDGNALDLTGASSIKLKVALPDASTCKFIGTCTVDDAVAGKCHYTIASGNFDTVATYNSELEITYPSKTITSRGLTVRVLKELPAT